jgi:hypothetical protein
VVIGWTQSAQSYIPQKNYYPHVNYYRRMDYRGIAKKPDGTKPDETKMN